MSKTTIIFKNNSSRGAADTRTFTVTSIAGCKVDSRFFSRTYTGKMKLAEAKSRFEAEFYQEPIGTDGYEAYVEIN